MYIISEKRPVTKIVQVTVKTEMITQTMVYSIQTTYRTDNIII